MARGYKVRLGDGSEIGPLDLSAVREWYQQGLINKKSAVLTPGSKRWTTLADVAELKDLGTNKGSSSAALRAAVQEATESASPTSSRARTRDEEWSGGSGLSGIGDRWRMLVAAILLFGAAAEVGLVAWRPQRVLPEFEGLPWTETALALLVFGLCLVRGWEWGRKLVRFAVLLIAVAMFPLMGILFAQGVRGPALLAAVSAWVVFSGLFALLGTDLAWPKAVLAILVVLAGGTGLVYFGYSPETEARRQLIEWMAPDRAFTDDALGVSFQVPPGWRILRKDNPLVAAPPDAKLTLAQPRLGGFGFFLAESSPSGVASLDQYLSRIQAARRRMVPSLREAGRSEVAVGRLPGRKAVGTWDKEGVRYADEAAVWKDGWVYFALVEWLPEGSSSAPERELGVLLAGFKTNGVLAEKLQQAVQNVTLAVPHLSPTAAEMLMGQSQARVLEPDQAFRRALDAAARALPTWTKNDTEDFAQITAATYAALSLQERNRLAAYVERVRARQLTSSEDDREMSRLMKAAVLRLPPAKRERLQALYEQAIRSAPGG
jgi:hypothetical protein